MDMLSRSDLSATAAPRTSSNNSAACQQISLGIGASHWVTDGEVHSYTRTSEEVPRKKENGDEDIYTSYKMATTTTTYLLRLYF